MRSLIVLLMLSTTALAQGRVQDVPAPDSKIWSGGGAWTIDPNIKPSLMIHTGAAPDAYVIIHPDGTIEYGKDYMPDTAAKALWDAMGIERKARSCP